MMNKSELNAFYRELEHRANLVLGQWVTLRSRPAELRYYSGHYTKNSVGIYEADAFPIPVLSIKGLCDVEFHIDQIQVTTKLKKWMRSTSIIKKSQDILLNCMDWMTMNRLTAMHIRL